MTVQPDSAPLMTARSLIKGQGHPSQISRLRQPWRLETSGQVFGVRHAVAADLPAVMGMLVRSSALSRWQWRRTNGGAVPSLSQMSAWLSRPGHLVVLAPGRPGAPRRESRVVALAGLGDVDCAGGAVTHVARAELIVADPWQRLGVGRALLGHLAAAAWLVGRCELMAAAEAEPEAADRMLAAFGLLRTATHPHGAHARVRLSSTAVAGLGPLRAARLG
jgi:GNAT superfamily N-acetyltransferase